MNPRPAGPFDVFTFANGASAPWYLIPFDKEGGVTGPETLRHLMDAAKQGGFTDIHIFSHGWNNVFNDAVSLYREFWSGYFGIRDQLNLSDPGAYRPLVVGVIWPSTALVSDEEQTPAFAGSSDAEVEELASDLPPRDAKRLREISAAGQPLSRDEALELARILLPIYNRPEPDSFVGASADPVTPEELVELWVKTNAGRKNRFGDLDGGAAPLPDDTADPRSGPSAAGNLDFLDPMKVLRTATVYQMKDRAGKVGSNGVSQLLRDLLASCSTPVHLLGHSYGGRVVLSALCAQPVPRKVRSVLLLQPAVNYLCFAADANGKGRPGGYRAALDRVERPIFTTFSSHDMPLTKTFHFALRRDRDLGEAIIAAPDLAPSRFAALGGFGPGGLSDGELQVVPMLAQPAKYEPAPGRKILALDGSDDKIQSHGDVRNRFTEWAHLNLVSPEAL